MRHEDGQQAKNEVLYQALLMERPEFIELAIAHGAEVTSVPFLDVLMTGDRALVDSFLQRGADPIANDPFARAFYQLRAKTTLGSYLDCRRRRPDLVEHLQRQADIALRQFSQEGNLKWVSLLMWAGANPRSRGPGIDDIDNSEYPTTALHEGSACGNVDVLKRLRPRPDDDLAGMLERAAYPAHGDTLDYLLALGANPNDKPDGGSSALDACLQFLGWERLERVQRGDFATYESPRDDATRGGSAIRVLLRYGAIWSPDASMLNRTRRILYKLEPDLVLELIGQLAAPFSTPRRHFHLRRSSLDAALLFVRVKRHFSTRCANESPDACGHPQVNQPERNPAGQPGERDGDTRVAGPLTPRGRVRRQGPRQ